MEKTRLEISGVFRQHYLTRDGKSVTATIIEKGFQGVKKTGALSLRFIGSVLIVIFSITGCTDTSHTGSMLTLADVDRYIFTSDEMVCLQNDSDSACLKLTPKSSGGAKGINAPIIHIHPRKLIYVFYHEGKQILRAERAMDTSEIVKELGYPRQYLDDDQSDPDTSQDNGDDGNVGTIVDPNPPPVNDNPSPPVVDTSPPPPVNNNPPPPVVDTSPPPPVNNNPPPPVVDTSPPPPVNNNPPPPVVDTSPPPSRDNNPPVNNNPPPPVNNNPPVDNTPPPPAMDAEAIDAHHVHNVQKNGWIIWIYYNAPEEAYTLEGSRLTIKINGNQITNDDITSFARVSGGRAGTGVQFFYPTDFANYSSLTIEVTGLVSATETVIFSMNSPVGTSPEGISYQLDPL